MRENMQPVLTHPQARSDGSTQPDVDFLTRVLHLIEKGQIVEVKDLFISRFVFTNVSDVKNVYGCLFEIIPKLNEQNYVLLRDSFLPFILHVSKNMPEEQRQLAIQIGHCHLNNAEAATWNESLPIYLEAMEYLGQAINIAEMINDKIQETHLVASQLFMKMIKRYLSVENQIHNREKLLRFCCDDTDVEFLNQQEPSQDHKLKRSQDTPCITQTYRTLLKDIRENFTTFLNRKRSFGKS